MTQLEIATQIFCSGKAETLELAYSMAGELLFLETAHEKVNPINEEEIEVLKDRTMKRTQQLMDLGFEWNEANNLFELDHKSVSTKSIEGYSDEEWDYLIDCSVKNTTEFDYVITGHKEETIEENTLWQKEAITDIFNGKTYIEFEMEKSILRIFKIEDRVQAEDDLQITKKADSKFIIAYSDNEEHQLGITIFKK